MAVDQHGNLFVADSGNQVVQKCTLNGSDYNCAVFAGVTGEKGHDFGHFVGPASVAVDASDRVYVGDSWNARIQVFDSSGAYLTTIGGWGTGSGQMGEAGDVALDSQGNLYIADGWNDRIQKFTPGVPGWQQTNINGFGDSNTFAVNRMSVFNGYLYASTHNYSSGGAVWRSANGTDWNKVSLDGFGSASNGAAFVGAPFNGYLYAGTGNSDGEIWRCAICDGTDWTQVVSGGFGDSNNGVIQRVVVFSNSLYATVDNGSSGVEVWKSLSGNPGSWVKSNADGFGDAKNTGLWAATVFNNYLYTATAQWAAYADGTNTGIEVWRTKNGSTWSQVNTDGFGSRENISPWMESFNGYLYVLATNFGTGAQIWRCASCDGTDWTRVVDNGFGDINNSGGVYMVSYGGYFYAGTGNDATGMQLWQTTNGTNWSQVGTTGFGDSNNEPFSGAVFNGGLYFGTSNHANGGEIWQSSAPGAFNKSSPANAATNQPNNPTLQWAASSNATSYEYCIGTSVCTAASIWTSAGTATSQALSGLKANKTYYWQVRAVNASGSTYANAGTSWSFKTGLLSTTFQSVGSYDGWVLEASAGKGIGGTLNASGTTLMLGDDMLNRQYRSILSFNTSSLPDNAVISSVTLKVMKQSSVGTNPFSKLGALTVDLRKPYFGTSVGLVASDFQATAGKSGVGTFSATPVGSWYTATLGSGANANVNLTGTTQFRLRFATASNKNGIADNINFYSGNFGTAADRPVLIIQYYVP